MSTGGTSGPSSGGNHNKVGALLLAGLGGIIGFIIFTGGGDDNGGGSDGILPTSQPQPVATTAPASGGPSSGAASQVGTEKETLRAGDPSAVVITVTAFGMPARVGIEAEDASKVKSSGMYVAGNVNLACIPDAQYPNPCVSYMVVERGTTVTVTAGNSRAGYWPILDALRGGGCDRPGTGGDRDVTCMLTLFQDADIVATYYGSDTPNGRYDFPKCPAVRETTSQSEWITRCQ